MTTDEIINKVAKRVVELRLTPIAIIILESIKPLSFLTSQVLVFFQPIVTSILPLDSYEEFVKVLEERENLEKLIKSIEDAENESDAPRRLGPEGMIQRNKSEGREDG